VLHLIIRNVTSGLYISLFTFLANHLISLASLLGRAGEIYPLSPPPPIKKGGEKVICLNMVALQYQLSRQYLSKPEPLPSS